MSGIKIECLTGPCALGEGPHWDAESQTLYYVDIFSSSIHKYVPSTNTHTSAKVDEKLGASIIIPLAGHTDKFVVTIGTKVTIVTWDGISDKPQHIEPVYDENIQKHIWNDGKADSKGRLWVGSFSQDYVEHKVTDGNLFSISKDRKAKKHLGEIGIANGLAWSSDDKKMYYIDTHINTVDVLDFDLNTGTLSNRRTCFDIKTANITPTLKTVSGLDGMTIDTDGNLWIAVFNPGCILKVDPRTGRVLQNIDIPETPEATSVAFGGKNLDELYVTSGSLYFTDEEKKKYPKSGSLFRITGLGVKGLPGIPVQM